MTKTLMFLNFLRIIELFYIFPPAFLTFSSYEKKPLNPSFEFLNGSIIILSSSLYG